MVNCEKVWMEKMVGLRRSFRKRKKRPQTLIAERKSAVFGSPAWVSAAVLAALLLTSCGKAESGGNVTTVSIQKDGTVSNHIEESFSQSYYDAEELRQAILMEAADFNKAAGSDAIGVEKIEVDEGVVTVRMTYQNSGDYAAFNDVIFFAGAAKDAPADYELNVVLSGVKDEGQTVGKSDILSMDGYMLLVTDISDPVNLNGKAEYVSDNVTVSDNRKCVQVEGEGMGYVLYK